MGGQSRSSILAFWRCERTLDTPGLSGLECTTVYLQNGQNCKFALILQRLVVQDGTLQGPHRQDLAVCTALA
ncbi:hypothetical protein WJX77_003571 [Trebouxia sp. C0004]